MLDDLASSYPVVAGRTLIGFCCIGEAVRVPGMTKEPATLDVGMGMDPAQVGRGNRTVFGRAVLNYLSTAELGQALRAVVQRWNERSLRLTRRYEDDFDAEFPTMDAQQLVAVVHDHDDTEDRYEMLLHPDDLYAGSS